MVVPVDLLQEEQHGFGSKRRQIIGGGEGVYAGDPLDVQETVVERDGVLLHGCLGRGAFRCEEWYVGDCGRSVLQQTLLFRRERLVFAAEAVPDFAAVLIRQPIV